MAVEAVVVGVVVLIIGGGVTPLPVQAWPLIVQFEGVRPRMTSRH
ncbi:hypothetical protein [Mycobacterium kansasii]|nr:hypothetical protein [Mycobacterium kansasii]